jgi:hypothetical protein
MAQHVSAAAFTRRCSSCPQLQAVMDAYAAFHARVFDDPKLPCAERRVLLVRESFSDAVGIGQMHISFHRYVALAVMLGRALVFSACEAPDDLWALRLNYLFRNAQPFTCSESYLDFTRMYEGHGGISFEWSAERRARLRRCGITERAVDLNSPRWPPRDGSNLTCTFPGCTKSANPDLWFSCAKSTGAHCPALQHVFGAAHPELASAPLLALYNARRDAGGQQA